MSLLSISSRGDYDKTLSWLKNLKFNHLMNKLEKYGQDGVAALSAATPKRSGETASSWYYEVKQYPKQITISWKNSNIVDSVPIAIIIQYGHGTRNGGYVQGIDYINPAIQPIFEKIEEDIWKEITKL